MAVRIVNLTARVGLDGTSFQQGLHKLTQGVEQFGSALTGMAGIETFRRIAQHISETIGRIKDLSEQFGVTTSEVQKLDMAAAMSGQRFEQIGAAMENLGASRKEAAEGNEELRLQFARFGVVLDDLQNPALRNIDLMQQMATSIQKMNLTAADTVALRELFGKTGGRLVAVFNDLQKLKVQPIGEEDILLIDQATKALERFKLEATAIAAKSVKRASFLGLGFTIGEHLRDNFFPATAESPRARSAEMVGPTPPVTDPLFKDKNAPKGALPLEIQMALTTLMAAKEALKLRPLRDRQGREDFLGRANIGQLGGQGAFTGLGLERAFALRGTSDKQQRIEENTRRTVEVLNRINTNIENGGSGDDLEF